MIAAAGHPAPGPALQETPELRARYRAYRRRQAARLVQLMPREAVRPLYRLARERLAADGLPQADDPLALLTRLCETLLPLPPFDVWRDDLLRNQESHLHDLAESVHGPTAETPATLEARDMISGGRRWRVLLRAFHADGAWRGLMVFQDSSGGPAYRTAPVFREPGPVELRERFRSFEPTALEAFLRSARP